MKKANSTTKAEKAKEAQKEAKKSQKSKLEIESHNFVKSKEKAKLSDRDYSIGIQTLESLKNMLRKVTKERLSSSDADVSHDLLNELQDQNNSDMIMRYLTDSKHHKLPITFKKKLDQGLMMISRMQTKSQQEDEELDKEF